MKKKETKTPKAEKEKIYTMAPYIKSVLKFLAQRQNQFFGRGGRSEKKIAFGTTVKKINLIREEVNKKLRPKEPFQPKSLERIFQHLKKEGFLKPAKGEKERFVVSPRAYKLLSMERADPGKAIGGSVKPPEAVTPPAAPQVPAKVPQEEPKKVVKEYRPKEVYEQGDIVYHKVWKEEGEVIGRGETAEGHKIAIVSFPREGRKKLIMGYSSLRI